MKWPKMPEIKFRRVHVERTLIGCSAALVLLLSMYGISCRSDSGKETKI